MISMRVCRYQSLVVDRLRSGVERLEFDSIRARLVVFRSIETKLEVVETIKATEALQDLIEEAKLRTVYWALCIFAVSYFLTHTSKSMWMNIPISILFVSALRILFNEEEFHWKVRKIYQQTYLSHLEKTVNDSRLSTTLPPPKWKRKIDSPVVEAAIEEFVNKILQDFVSDLWYSEITPDKEVPELIRAVIMDALGEVSGRVKEINLVDLVTRYIFKEVAIFFWGLRSVLLVVHHFVTE
ncbi:hypothetical protein TEA_021480 [Camellia sinensis var. sinensis]|uniref:PXA domain-containing protein n=1 Tax=Camellia sinensis var. sinensis TaxID=542762 RepID=A0A4S4CYF3_CAMSN|nr:hypothetical protein TEA_021480 [Camellia sinensis var. sinensis]